MQPSPSWYCSVQNSPCDYEISLMNSWYWFILPPSPITACQLECETTSTVRDQKRLIPSQCPGNLDLGVVSNSRTRVGPILCQNPGASRSGPPTQVWSSKCLENPPEDICGCHKSGVTGTSLMSGNGAPDACAHHRESNSILVPWNSRNDEKNEDIQLNQCLRVPESPVCVGGSLKSSSTSEVLRMRENVFKATIL